MKIKVIAGTLFFSMILLVGCQSIKSDIDINDLMNNIKSEVKFEDDLAELDRETIGGRYQIDESITAIVQAGSGATAEEIAIFRAPDKARTKKLEKLIKNYIAETKKSFEHYIPEEVKRLDDAVMMVKENYVILVVSADAEAQKKINELLT